MYNVREMSIEYRFRIIRLFRGSIIKEKRINIKRCVQANKRIKSARFVPT